MYTTGYHNACCVAIRKARRRGNPIHYQCSRTKECPNYYKSYEPEVRQVTPQLCSDNWQSTLDLIMINLYFARCFCNILSTLAVFEPYHTILLVTCCSCGNLSTLWCFNTNFVQYFNRTSYGQVNELRHSQCSDNRESKLGLLIAYLQFSCCSCNFFSTLCILINFKHDVRFSNYKTDLFFQNTSQQYNHFVWPCTKFTFH